MRLPWARPFRFERCVARLEPNVSGYWGRCELRRDHTGLAEGGVILPHMLDRGMLLVRWSTMETLRVDGMHVALDDFMIEDNYNPMQCNCSVHDITEPGAAHANDCPMFE